MQRPYYSPHFPTQSDVARFLRNGISRLNAQQLIMNLLKIANLFN